MEKTLEQWRSLVACAAEIKIGHVTQFSPEGLADKLRIAKGAEYDSRWYLVVLGPLVLHHDGKWQYLARENTAEAIMKYAHVTEESAERALKEEVYPEEPRGIQ